MNFAEQQRSPLRGIVGFAIVAALHIALVYALVMGLGQGIIDIIKPPLTTKIIKDNKPPPPDAPPPPPPEMVQPPPPYVPPPDINVANPNPVNNAITQTTTTAPPAQMAVTAPPRTAPAVADTGASARPIAGPKLEYPDDMQEEEREGSARISCDVDINGSTSNCSIDSVNGGSSFGRAALEYAERSRYRPAIRNGVAVPEHHQWLITFKLND